MLGNQGSGDGNETPPTEGDLLALIDDEVEESLQLEYKGAGALQPSRGKKKEVTKDVSAMANSAGGHIIYGIAEYDDEDFQHLPRELDPINRTEFSKERLEQVVNNIQPRIDGLVIHPVPLSSGATDVAYVVDVPQSMTAHQAQDQRYYKRYNFQSVPMEDHEVRDVMGRSKHPVLDVRVGITSQIVEPSQLSLASTPLRPPSPRTEYYLEVWASNDGPVIGHHVVVALELPTDIVHPNGLADDEQEEQRVLRWCKNLHRDVVDSTPAFEGVRLVYGPPRYDPMLPNLARQLEHIRLTDNLPSALSPPVQVSWSAYADEAPPREDGRALTLDDLERALNP